MEILTAYLLDAKARGFREVLLWACPPTPSNADLIFYIHPSSQRFLRDELLKMWCVSMICTSSSIYARSEKHVQKRIPFDRMGRRGGRQQIEDALIACHKA